MLSLITSPLLRVVIGGAVCRLTLPQTLAALMQDKVETFQALRPHQRHAWHMFLAQLAAIALHRADMREVPADAAAWAGLLLALTGNAEEPWSLVVADLAQPAFLQPTVPEDDLAVLKNRIPTPDALDVLITARNFDVKAAVAAEAEADEWLFALVSLQTMEGYSGSTWYGIARMNGGSSSRPFLGLAPIGGVGAHVKRDIRSLMAGRVRLLKQYDFYDEDGLALLWLKPWNGQLALQITHLDPWFIEICRRVRLVQTGKGIEARSVGSGASRVNGEALHGMTGDFWAPVDANQGKSLSLGGQGFSYRTLCRLLFGEGDKRSFRLPAAMEAQPGEGDMTLVARCLAREDGKTAGFHERLVPLRRGMVLSLAIEERRRTLGQIAGRQQQEIEQISRALRLACAVVAVGGGEEKLRKEHYARAEPFTRRLEAEADAGFFDALQDRDAQGDAARGPWLRHLVDHAQALLAEAAGTIPCPSRHRWRARVRAPVAFRGMLLSDKGALADDRDLIFPKKETADAGT